MTTKNILRLAIGTATIAGATLFGGLTVATAAASPTDTAPQGIQQRDNDHSINVWPSQPKSAPTFSDCASLNAVYPHGVGLPGATARDGSKDFHTNARIYYANQSLDKYQDGIACEA